MLKNILMVLFIMFVAAGTSFASGSLFPPENRGNGEACGDGYALSWTGGSLKCVGISSTNKCTGNDVMVSLANGSAVCTSIGSLVKTIVNGCKYQELRLGVTANVNAGVVTTTSNHNYGETKSLGRFLTGC